MTDLSSLLPNNATPYEYALEQTQAQRMAEIAVPVRDMWNPTTCPSALLPWLAWGFSIDQWNSNWTDDQKRSAIKSAVYKQQHKGTIGAVQQAINELGYDAVIQEWFNQAPLGDPYTFDLLVDSNQVGVTEVGYAEIIALINTYKNLRSHLGLIHPSITTRCQMTLGGALCVGQDYLILDATPIYSDGVPALDLLLDAAINGESSTITALDSLDNMLRVTMPANSWSGV